jgi:hypothetical protein
MMKRALTAAAAAVALAAGVPGVASAATTWTFQTAPAYGNTNQLGSVSCPASSFCVAPFSAVHGGYDTVDMWNGTAWSAVTVEPTGEQYIAATAVSCASATNCVLTGENPDNNTPLAATWNGTGWTTAVALPDPSDAVGTLEGVSCTSATACMAVSSSFATEQLTGGSWQEQTAPMPSGATDGELTGVSCVSADACTAVGYYIESSDGPVLPVAEFWNGSAWAIQTTPALTDTRLYSVSCTSAANCSAVGATFTTSPTTYEPVALQWNGSSWAQESVPLPKGAKTASLNGVACPAARSCTAVGQYTTGAKNTILALAEVWNGSKWMAQATASPATDKSLNGISCLAARTCTAVGSPEGYHPIDKPVVVEHE